MEHQNPTWGALSYSDQQLIQRPQMSVSDAISREGRQLVKMRGFRQIPAKRALILQ